MPKKILIMRHAKSSWADETVSDHDRPLNDRGIRDAPRMGQFLVEKCIVPDLVICSSAKRALSTARIVCEQFALPRLQPDIVEDFYLAAPDVYLETLGMLDDRFSCPMVVGHNPGLEHLVYVLTGAHELMPTAAIAHIGLEIDHWKDIQNALERSVLQQVFRPKESL